MFIPVGTQHRFVGPGIGHRSDAAAGELGIYFLLAAVILTTRTVDSLLWRDVKQYSPQSIFRNKLDEVARTPLQTIVRLNCTINRYSKSQAGISGYGCRDIPPLEKHWDVSQLFVHHTGVRTIRPGVFMGCCIRKLELSQNKITIIKPNSFLGLDSVEFLGLNENPISHIRVGAFRGLWRLRRLVLFHTRIQYWSSIVPAVAELPRLQLLDLGFTLISKIDEADLEPLRNSTLAYVSLCNCASLSSIHPKALTHLRNLVGLYLKSNVNLVRNRKSYTEFLYMIGNLTQPSFRVIDVSRLTQHGNPREILKKIAQTGTQVLLLSQSLREISINTFPVMPNITSLVIPLAKMPIENGGLATLPNLREIVFTQSFIPDFPVGMALPQLEYVDISGFDRNPQALEFPEQIFRNMSRLRELSVRYRAIPDLVPNTFEGLVALEHLDMAYCHISYLPAGVFEPLISLTYLDLTANTIFLVAEVPKNIFAPLINLRYLSLALTAAEWFTADMFNDLVNLEVLKLNNNSLSFVPDLSSNKKLRALDVSANQLSWFEEYKFSNGSYRNRLPASLSSLDLSNNEISYHVKIPPTIRHLNLSNNPFMCSCDLLALLPLIKNASVEVVNLEFESLYECSRPFQLQGLHVVAVGATLENKCRPQLIIFAAALLITLLIAVILMVGALVYRVWFSKWIERYSSERFSDAGGGTANKSYDFDAFVSYSAHDVHFVINDLLPCLEELRKLKLCVYDRDFLAGQTITDCVLDSMKRSRKIIIVLSDHFLQSPWCKFETDLAQFTMLEENRDAFILVKVAPIDESRLSGRLSYLLRTRVHLDYCTLPRDKFFLKLVEAVRDDRPRYQRFRRNVSTVLDGGRNASCTRPSTSPGYRQPEKTDVNLLRGELTRPQALNDIEAFSQQACCRAFGQNSEIFQNKLDLHVQHKAGDIPLSGVPTAQSQVKYIDETNLPSSAVKDKNGRIHQPNRKMSVDNG
ncbi:toll receptor 13-like [Tropilaelaps mercedesae]|uniref:Toll receptor 13-like n=1 Tax=Tropilaelaps mercedesae TaxID=418985 RepID=A0A1V9XZX2_9ACAR|nr:toll receptor 13-like [Tropilaelaps mercedesae]